MKIIFDSNEQKKKFVAMLEDSVCCPDSVIQDLPDDWFGNSCDVGSSCSVCWEEAVQMEVQNEDS